MWEPLSDLSGSEHRHPSPGEVAFTTGLVVGQHSFMFYLYARFDHTCPLPAWVFSVKTSKLSNSLAGRSQS